MLDLCIPLQRSNGFPTLAILDCKLDLWILLQMINGFFALAIFRPLDDDDDDENNASDDDTSRKKSEPSSWQVHDDDSTADSVEASKDSQQDRERDRTDEDRLSSQLRHELSEAKRAKLREIEVRCSSDTLYYEMNDSNPRQ